jgi:hypothetical protein
MGFADRCTDSAFRDVLHVANVATVLDDYHPARFKVRFAEQDKFVWFAFQRGTNEKILAVWLGQSRLNQLDEIGESRSDITLQGIRAKQAWVVDLINGTEQELRITPVGKDTFIEGIRIKNYPTIIRFVQ